MTFIRIQNNPFKVGDKVRMSAEARKNSQDLPIAVEVLAGKPKRVLMVHNGYITVEKSWFEWRDNRLINHSWHPSWWEAVPPPEEGEI